MVHDMPNLLTLIDCDSGDQDQAVPFIGSRRLVDGLATKLKLNTTVPYKAWFENKQVSTIYFYSIFPANKYTSTDSSISRRNSFLLLLLLLNCFNVL